MKKAVRLILVLGVLGAGAGAYYFLSAGRPSRSAPDDPRAVERDKRLEQDVKMADERRRLQEKMTQAPPTVTPVQDPVADVRRTLDTVEEINRINRMNQELREKSRVPKAPPSSPQ
jgi:hypothetical protein